MEFEQLAFRLPFALRTTVDELLARKATADEKTTVPQPAALVAYLQQEYDTAQIARAALPVPHQPNPTPALHSMFRAWL